MVSKIFSIAGRIESVTMIQRFHLKEHTDNRGSFMEIFKGKKFSQANILKNNPGSFRGLHYQMNPKAQGKLVYCISGKIIDIAVDIRKGSPNYGKAFTYVVEGDTAVYIPEGYAHGIYATGKSVVVYLTTRPHSPSLGRGIAWDDPDINLARKVKIAPILSEKDKHNPLLKDAENNYVYEPFK